jgi:transcriptional regulator GlxA family with amidase domain
VRRFTPEDFRRIADEYLTGCESPEKSPSVNGLAKLAGVRRERFSDEFLRLVGERPSEYLKRGQIERAKTLLVTTHLTMDEVAYACCYANIVTFFRAFRRSMGTTPARFRKMHARK